MYEGTVLFPDFEKHHLEVLNAIGRFKVIVWHRKSRKTTLVIKNLIRECFRKKGVYWYLAPFLNQARQIVWDDPGMLDRWLPPQCKKNGSELKITFPNGSLLYIKGADNEESLRGPGLQGIAIDEFDDIDLNVWNFVIRPMLSLTQGWAWFVGTFKGASGNLAKFVERENDAGWWVAPILRADTSGLIPKEEIDSILQEVRNGTYPEVAYRQEYLCEKTNNGANLFRRIEENVWDGNLNILPNKKYKIGVDLAKLNDFTVLTPIDLHSWYVGKIDRFQQLDYPMIEARIEAMYHKYNKAQLQIEQNSIGEAVIDHLIHDKSITNINPLVITERSREAILKNLSVLLETDQIKIPNDEVLIKELKAMRYERDEKTKKIKIISPIHDDTVFSLAHAVWDLKAKVPYEKPISGLGKELLEYRKAQKAGQDKVINRI